jgi:predicted metal-dependent hydrolase
VTDFEFAWPPPFTIRKSARSSVISLRISAKAGLEIVLPLHATQKQALNFLHSKFDWVKKHYHLLRSKESLLQLPKCINLATIDEQWQISYRQKIKRKLQESRATQTLLVDADLSFVDTVKVLKSWLMRKAKQHLPELILMYSQKYQLPFGALSVRMQKSRWGSCSVKKDINLNGKLLFLPPEITHYIIVHELMHTIHFNHSASFWADVAKIIPDYRRLCADLKMIEQALPNWLY